MQTVRTGCCSGRMPTTLFATIASAPAGIPPLSRAWTLTLTFDGNSTWISRRWQSMFRASVCSLGWRECLLHWVPVGLQQRWHIRRIHRADRKRRIPSLTGSWRLLLISSTLVDGRVRPLPRRLCGGYHRVKSGGERWLFVHAPTRPVHPGSDFATSTDDCGTSGTALMFRP